MAEAITAKYVQENDDWTVTVSGGEKQLTGRAPGIIAARDSVDQLVEKLGADFKGATVVHLLNGSALDFTAAYMTARLTLPEVGPLEVPAPAAAEKAGKAGDKAEDKASDKTGGETAEAKSEPAEKEPAEKTETVPEQAQAPEATAKPQNKASRRPKAKLTADIGDALESSPDNTKLPTATGAVSVATMPSARA